MAARKSTVYTLKAIFLLVTALYSTAYCGCESGGSRIPTVAIERFDPGINSIIPEDARLEKIADGFSWVEGPVWDRNGNCLLFSDIPENAVFKWEDGKGARLYLKPSGYTGKGPFKGKEPGSNGLAVDSEGRLVLAQHGDRRIIRLEPDGAQTVLAESYHGRRLNSPNDLVFKSNGDLYFTDPPFGLPGTFDDPQKELPFQGVYRLSPEGEIELLTREIKAPNGIAFSPDEKTLYVTDVNPERPAWLAYDVRTDGTIANGRVFYDAAPFTKTETGAPDGVKTDREGNIYGAGPGGVYIFSPEGTLLGVIRTGVATSNLNWGNDGYVLYITASTAVYRIKLNTPGPAR